MSLEVLTLYIFAVFLLALSPGPDNLYVISQSLARGAITGVWITLGLCTGLVVHTFMVVVGITALVAAQPLLFQGLKWLGGGYLCYLAWLLWRASDPHNTQENALKDAWAYYKRGVLMNLSNPKVGLFFLAFLPQFVVADAAFSTSLQLMLLGALFIAVALLVFVGMAFSAGSLSRWLHRPEFFVWLNRVAAGIFVAMALRLVLVP